MSRCLNLSYKDYYQEQNINAGRYSVAVYPTSFGLHFNIIIGKVTGFRNKGKVESLEAALFNFVKGKQRMNLG